MSAPREQFSSQFYENRNRLERKRLAGNEREARTQKSKRGGLRSIHRERK